MAVVKLVVPALLAAFAVAVGCDRNEPIRHYRAPKDPTWRMLAAIVPGSEQTWFFKLVGSSPRVEPRKEEFLGLLRSVKVSGKEVKWTLPQGWKEEAGTGDRQATLRLGGPEPQLEVTVVQLQGTAGGVLANVNRWRGQLGLAALSESDLARQAVTLDLGGIQATVVDLEGPLKPATGRPMAASAPSGDEASLDAVRSLFAFEVPSGWAENRTPQQGRVLELRAGDALVTLVVLGETAGGLTAHLNRWRDQAGLDALDEEGARRLVRTLPFLGRDGSYVEVAGPRRSILCAFTLGPPFSIFLKMDGAPDVVAGQRAAFEAFARSLRLAKKDG
jgi:hypothetical protein